MDNSNRRQAIVSAAISLIAERGLEGFRVRMVATSAGMNHATLLHYFPNKQALVEAVVDQLLEQLRGEGRQHGEPSPWEALSHEFEDLKRRLDRDPSFFVALNEIQLRAYRDPRIARSLQHLYESWRHYLTSVIERGIAVGQFRPDRAVAEIVDVIMVQFRGLGLNALDQVDSKRMETAVAAQLNLLGGWILRQD